MPDWLITLLAGLTVFVGIPALVIFSAALPFLIVKKLMKKKLTPVIITICLIVSGGLLYLDFLGIYWGFALMQGIAACQLYSDNTVLQCLSWLGS